MKDKLIEFNEAHTTVSLDLSNLRQKFFQLGVQQDAAEFIGKLFNDSETSYLTNLCQFTRIIKRRCPSCSYENQQQEYDNIFNLLIPTQIQGHINSMQELLDYNMKSDWSKIEDSSCPECKMYNLDTRTLFSNFSQITIFCLQLSENNGPKMTSFKLNTNSVIRNDIVLNKERYSFSSAIFHHGATFKSGHYTAIYKLGKQLIKADDSNVNKLRRWPDHSKDIYILLYTKAQK